MRALQDIIPWAAESRHALAETEPALSLRNVSFSFEARSCRALRNVSLDIANGDFIVITGPSGCGKSTLAAAMSGYIPHVVRGNLSGEILIRGFSSRTEDLSCLAARTGLCQQDPESQLCTLNVSEEVAFGPENLGLPAHEVLRRLRSALAAVKAVHLKDRTVSELSGGEKQRVAIASMLAMQPDILILDEPTSSLDPDSADEVFSAIEDLRRERHLTVIVVEHRYDRLLPLADRMIVMRDGTIEMDGNPDEIHRRYRVTAESRSQNPAARRIFTGRRDTAVVARDVRFSYKNREILRGVSFSARKGECIGIIGPNGSGKTTFLNCLAGLCHPSKGVIRINGIDAGSLRVSEIARHVGFVFQNPNHQIFEDTVYDEVVFACNNFGIGREEAGARAMPVMNAYGISRYARCNPLTLSHGEKRRLNVCSTLPHGPGILILDEPFIGQDIGNTAIITEDFRRLTEAGKTLLVVSHDMDWVFQHCDRVVYFNKGCILIDETPSEAIHRLRDIGAINFLPETYE